MRQCLRRADTKSLGECPGKMRLVGKACLMGRLRQIMPPQGSFHAKDQPQPFAVAAQRHARLLPEPMGESTLRERG